VRFGGAKVGRVSAITLDPADQSQIRVEAQIAENVPINKESKAYITQTSLTAEMHLEITTGNKEAALLEDGGKIDAGAGGMFAQMGALAEQAQAFLDETKKLMGVKEAKEKATAEQKEMVTVASLFDSVDETIQGGSDLVEDIRGVVGDTKDDVSKILAKVQEIEDSSKTLISDLNGMLGENRASIKGALDGVQGIVEDAGPIVERVKGVSDRLDEMAAALQATLDNAKSLSGDTQGLINNNRPVIEDIVLDLRETVRYLKDFSRTMAEQPEAVIRGKSPEGRK
jgi:ABC-type transporter Mla subunit MlaD